MWGRAFARSRVLRMARVSYLDDLAALDTAEGQAAVRQCRAHLERHGWVHLPGFVAREEVDGMVRECLALEQGGAPFLSVESHTPYQEEQDPSFPDDHPRNAMQESSKLIVDYAKVPADSPLRKLYHRDDLRRFIRGVVQPYLPSGADADAESSSSSSSSGSSSTTTTATTTATNSGDGELFPSACDFNAAYYNIYRPGHGLGWHFDRSAFGVNLVLKTAAQVPGGGGGVFEWCAHTRTSPAACGPPEEGRGDPWAFDKVRDILKGGGGGGGGNDGVTRVTDLGPGSLVIFAGIASLHRVTPVTASPEAEAAAAAAGIGPEGIDDRVERINAILTYETKPGQRMNAYGLKKFFGREIKDSHSQ